MNYCNSRRSWFINCYWKWLMMIRTRDTLSFSILKSNTISRVSKFALIIRLQFGEFYYEESKMMSRSSRLQDNSLDGNKNSKIQTWRKHSWSALWKMMCGAWVICFCRWCFCQQQKNLELFLLRWSSCLKMRRYFLDTHGVGWYERKYYECWRGIWCVMKTLPWRRMSEPNML